MEYGKPIITARRNAVSAIEGSNVAAKGTIYLEGPVNPNGLGWNDVAPAYEADE